MQLIELHEGRSNRLYKDSRDIWTIGIGHNIQEQGLSDKVIDIIFGEDLEGVIADCETLSWWHRMDWVRQCAVVDLVYNMGMPVFRRFRQTIAYLERSEYDLAGDEILRGSRPDGKSHYYAQVGPRAVRISRMLKTGAWEL
jgi:lysozyme